MEDELTEELRDRVTHRIREIDRCGAGLDRLFADPGKERRIATGRVLSRELHIIRVFTGELHGLHSALHHLIRRHMKLHLHMNRARRDERVDTLPGSALDRFAGALDIALNRAGE